MANVRFFLFPQDNTNKYYAAGMSEQEQPMQWIAACCLNSLNVMRHTRICSVHSYKSQRIIVVANNMKQQVH